MGLEHTDSSGWHWRQSSGQRALPAFSWDSACEATKSISASAVLRSRRYVGVGSKGSPALPFTGCVT